MKKLCLAVFFLMCSTIAFADDMFDSALGVVHMPGVSVGADTYEIEMSHKGGLMFEVLSATLPFETSTSPDSFDLATGVLHMPVVDIDAVKYEIDMMHQGNLVFKVVSVAPVSQTTYYKFTSDWLNGKTLYNVYYEDDEQKWEIFTTVFTDTSLSGFLNSDPNDKIDNAPYSITDEGYLSFTSYDEDRGIDEKEYVKGLELTNDCLTLRWKHEIEKLSGNFSNDEYYYFDLQKAQDFVAVKNAEVAANSEMVTIEGNVAFVDADDNPIAIPSDAVVRITSDADQAEDEWESGFSIPVNSDGTFSLTQSMYLNSYKDGHTFQVVVFKNHIDVDKLHWECGEDLYTYLGGDLSYGAWKNIVVSPQDYQDISGEVCTE